MAMTEETPNLQQYNELRKKHREELLRSVDPTEALFSDLATIEKLKNKVSEIRSVKIIKEAADKILSLPADKNYRSTICPFITVLRKNGHAHVASVFTKGSKDELLTDDTFELLHKKLDELCTYLDPDCGIIESLISEGVFDESDEERVLARNTEHRKAREIIKIISRRSKSSYRSFVSVLEKMDQEHILHILNENGSPPISKIHLRLINKQREQIVKHIDSTHTFFVDKLVSLGVFTDIDSQRVEAKQTPLKRNRQILTILLRKSKRRFDKFLVALNRTEQGHLISLFQGIQINATLHLNLSDDTQAELEAVETLLRTTLGREIEDEESEISNELDDMGIYAAGVEEGCIRIWFKFLTRETLEMMRSDKLDRCFTERYCKMFSYKGLQSIHVVISEREFERCERICITRQAPMKPEHQQALQFTRDRIEDKMTVTEDLLDELSLHDCRRDAILSQSSEKDEVKVLLDVMTCRPDCEFQQLLNALRNTQQDNAANFIISKCIDLLGARNGEQP